MTFKDTLKKIVFISFLSIAIIILTRPEQAHAQRVTVQYPKFPVTINSTEIENELRQYPFIMYKGITYFPATYKDSQFMGLFTHWSIEKGLHITKIGGLKSQFDYDYDRIVLEHPDKITATIPNFPIVINGKQISNEKEPYPLLLYRDITYFPITWRFGYEEFGWGYHYDNLTGLAIETTRGYSNYMLSAQNFEKIIVGKSTRTDIEKQFNQKVDSYKSYDYIANGEKVEKTYFTVKSPDESVVFTFELDPTKEIVMSKDMNSYYSSKNTVSILDTTIHPKLKKGMTLEEVIKVIGQRQISYKENLQQAHYSYSATSKDSRSAFLHLTFDRVNGKQLLNDYTYSNEIYVSNIYQLDYANTKFTENVAKQIYVGMSYDALVKVTGYKGFLLKENFMEGQLRQNIMYIGPNYSPYAEIQLVNKKIVSIEKYPFWWIRP